MDVKIIRGDNESLYDSDEFEYSTKMAIEMVGRILKTFGKSDQLFAIATALTNHMVGMVQAEALEKQTKEMILKTFFESVPAPIAFAWSKEFDENLSIKIECGGPVK